MATYYLNRTGQHSIQLQKQKSQKTLYIADSPYLGLGCGLENLYINCL